MIDKKSLTQEWIDNLSIQYKNADKILIEKTIRALIILEGLSSVGLQYCFKGGTALMLVLQSPKRLSIDIDIIIQKKSDFIDEILNQVASDTGFLRMETQKRTGTSSIDKAHYKFFYHPLHSPEKEEAILLDILYENYNYSNLANKEIKFPFLLNSGEPSMVLIPSVEDLLGDKLTAFAPHTTGIPYFRKGVSMSMEIIKQLYDIGNAFDASDNLEIIKTTYNSFVKVEMEYRGLAELKPANVLDDTFQTTLCLSLRGTYDKAQFEMLQDGINRVARFIFSESFHIEKAIISASKAAYLSRLISIDQTVFEKYTGPRQIEDSLITNTEYNKLNKLKRSNPEAFYYWWKAIQLIESNETENNLISEPSINENLLTQNP